MVGSMVGRRAFRDAPEEEEEAEEEDRRMVVVVVLDNALALRRVGARAARRDIMMLI